MSCVTSLAPFVAVAQTHAEQFSYFHAPGPFKNPNYTANVSRRAENLQNVLTQERDKARQEREAMQVDGVTFSLVPSKYERCITDTSIEAPPQWRYITSLQVLCSLFPTDGDNLRHPAIGLRYHDKSV
ncbi:hypothetical protein NEOLEDRAFT_1098263 [Neolentinus lepideus HHB14362 ss-1]|uniref:Uncharacterized protein n=1 Tax=Neolentinus lepideus HHB14362 ss-1 TaxID=1314782 RepID=A0A165Q9R7_9AGAM|nr:hypothetical protein NEOLEDRAFT_1098263 [Neolentinus lepideus HHB14362 ss-1]